MTCCCLHAEELLGTRQPELPQDIPAAPYPAEPEKVAADQPDGSQTPGEDGESQAQSAAMPQAGIEQVMS